MNRHSVYYYAPHTKPTASVDTASLIATNNVLVLLIA